MTAPTMPKATPLFVRAPRPGAAPAPVPELPMSRAEMDALGWDECDIIIVTGDAYIDHPSFGMAVVGRSLERAGFRVGIIAQPDWLSAAPFTVLGRPRLFFGVTAGNMDSMVNRYTSSRRIRKDDAYTPNAEPDKRPDRAVLVYAQRCREAFKDTPVIIGASRPACGASPTTTTGRTRCDAACCRTRRPTCWSTATVSDRSSRSPTGWTRAGTCAR
jgi:hypothetical protein